MANWKHKLNIGSIFKDDEIPPRRKGQLIASKLRSEILPHYDGDDELTDIIESFEEDIPEDDGSGSDVEEFDNILNGLYDWSDWSHRLWVDTFSD